MVKLRLRFVVEDVDRYGNVRMYFRRRGESKIRLLGMPGSEEFNVAYQEALSKSAQSRHKTTASLVGSFGYLCRLYYASPTFKLLDKSTQSWRRRALMRLQ
jgi:hypothetical protein